MFFNYHAIEKQYYFTALIERVPMKMKIYPLSTILLLFTASIGAQAQLKKNIQLLFKPNDQFELKDTVSMIQYEGKQLGSRQIATFTLALNVLEKDPLGRIIIRARFTKQTDKSEDILKKVVTGYNSDDPSLFVKNSITKEERVANQCYKEVKDGLINKSFTVYVFESGMVKVTGYDSIVTEALKNVSIEDAEYRAGYCEGIKQAFNNEEVESRLEATFNYLPGKLVGIGDG